jgi:transposase
MRRSELTDEQWERIKPLLPAQKPRTGRPNSDHRQVINGINWVLKSGAPWRDLPERDGKVGTVSSRFYRWVQAGVWQPRLDALRQQADEGGEVDWDLPMLEASIVRVHQQAAGAKKGTRPPKPWGVVEGA